MPKPKPTPPKPAPLRLTAQDAGQLIAALQRLPEQAKVYGTDNGEIAVWQGQRHLAYINLTGY